MIKRIFKEVKVRRTAKGWKKCKVHTVSVWHWDGKEEHAKKRTLVITVSDKVKYSLSNDEVEEHSATEWAYFQCVVIGLSVVLMTVKMSWVCQVIK